LTRQQANIHDADAWEEAAGVFDRRNEIDAKCKVALIARRHDNDVVVHGATCPRQQRFFKNKNGALGTFNVDAYFAAENITLPKDNFLDRHKPNSNDDALT
jgi:hypothetical protein